MKRSEIRKDPWKARKTIIVKVEELSAMIDHVWISEDGWAEDKDYRNAIIDKLVRINRGVESLLERLQRKPSQEIPES